MVLSFGFSGFLSSGTKILTLKGQRRNSNRAKTIFQLMSDWTFLVVLIRPNRGSKKPQKYLSAWLDFRLNSSWRFDHSSVKNHDFLSENFYCFTIFSVWISESEITWARVLRRFHFEALQILLYRHISNHVISDVIRQLIISISQSKSLSITLWTRVGHQAGFPGPGNLNPGLFYPALFSSRLTRRFWTRNPEIFKTEPGPGPDPEFWVRAGFLPGWADPARKPVFSKQFFERHLGWNNLLINLFKTGFWQRQIFVRE